MRIWPAGGSVLNKISQVNLMGRRLYQNSKKKRLFMLYVLVYILNTVVHIINTAVDIINKNACDTIYIKNKYINYIYKYIEKLPSNS